MTELPSGALGREFLNACQTNHCSVAGCLSAPGCVIGEQRQHTSSPIVHSSFSALGDEKNFLD